MPVALTYYLTAPAAAAQATALTFPSDSAQLDCDAEQFDQAYFLELVARLLPEEYLRPLLLNPDSGYELFQAYAQIGARLSEAMHEVECGLVMLYAGGPAYAEVPVVFYRELATAGAVTVKAGTLVVTSIGGRAFETVSDVSFGALDLQVSATVRAVAPGYEYNVRGDLVTAGGEVLAGEIDTIEVLLLSPAAADPTIKVRQEVDASGGYPDWLALHGANRGLAQEDGETADAFRLRMRTLPDTVSPAALRRLAARILTPLGISWQFIETFDIRYVTCLDAPSSNVGAPTYQATPPTNPFYDENLLCFDDPRDPDPFRGRLLGAEDYLGGIIFAVDGDVTVLDYGFALDDPGTLLSEFTGESSGKRRGSPAYDLSGVAPSAALDGPDAGWDAAVATFYLELQKSKAAGPYATVDTFHTW